MAEDLFIDGKWNTGYGKEFHSFDPWTQEVVWEGSMASKSDVDRAFNSAREALMLWSLSSVEERISYLERFAKELELSKEAITEAISLETGKPPSDSIGEYNAMRGKIAISIDAYKDRCKPYEKDLPSGHSVTYHKPHGVIGVLGPFNFPGHLPNGHIIPALLAGNTVVFKASEKTPLVAKIMMKCWEQAELPAGVLNLVQGGKEVGQWIVNHPELNGLFFTGSYSTGQKLRELFVSQPGKILALEMGGNNPLIVSQVSDIPKAVQMTLQSAYLSAGQRCTCARRLILPENDSSEPFLKALKEAVENLTVGHFTESPEPFMGPVIDEASALRLTMEQAALISRGAKPLVTLKHLKKNTGQVSPGLIDVTNCSETNDEELFGPFLQVIRVEDFNEALNEANNTRYGLSAGLISDEEKEWKLFLSTIRAGVVNWNAPTTGAASSAPFGGIGCSGNFRPSAYYAADYCSYPVACIIGGHQ